MTSPFPSTGLAALSAVDLAQLIRHREVSAREVTEAHLDRIDEVNDQVNAVVTLVPELALSTAAELDEAVSRNEWIGPLHGLPVVHKDLFLTKGIRTTKGSRLYEDWVPDVDSLIVSRLRSAGAVTLGKSNTPEFGAGSQTFNEVFGATRNPHDLSRTAGGSSGGAAAALAAGMVPIADGSDMGGSLRNPASFCGVVGLRPSPGRVPSWPTETPWSPLSVHGPMARSVADVRLMLQAIAGPDPRAPLSMTEPASVFGTASDHQGAAMVGWTDLGLPFATEVTEALRHVPGRLEGIGWTVTDEGPDLEGADMVFQTLRAWEFEVDHGAIFDRDRATLKETIQWNVLEARRRTPQDFAEAERARAKLVSGVAEYFGRFDAFMLPTVQVVPFDVETEWVEEIEGLPMRSYIEWMRSCSDISVLGLPAISIPAGQTSTGMPVGLQIVGRPRGDVELLSIAAAVESALAS